MSMWDAEPVLYWRLCQNGKWTWKKAKVAYVPNMGLYAIEPPRMRQVESDESE